jgi:hypothetical protein
MILRITAFSKILDLYRWGGVADQSNLRSSGMAYMGVATLASSP